MIATVVLGVLYLVAAILGMFWGLRDHKQFTKVLTFEVARIQLLLNEMQDLLSGF